MKNNIKNFIKEEIETNDYYEKIKAEYETAEDKDYYIYKVYNIFLDWYNGYYSVWTILDTIEDYMEENNWNFEETISYEDFTIKELY